MMVLVPLPPKAVSDVGPKNGDRESAAMSFILENTRPTSVPEASEIELYLADEITPMWEATEILLAQNGVAPPYWAFAWPGSRALARWIAENPSIVAGRRVLDVATGCGLAALVAARAGAKSVTANDIDPHALTAVRLAADRNGLDVRPLLGDLTALPSAETDADIVLVGDVCYEADTAARMMTWLRALAAAGVTVYMADPGRKFAPADGVAEIARFSLATSLDLETTVIKDTVVWQVTA